MSPAELQLSLFRYAVPSHDSVEPATVPDVSDLLTLDDEDDDWAAYLEVE